MRGKVGSMAKKEGAKKNGAEKVIKADVKVPPKRKEEPRALTLCGNDTCFLRAECARFTKGVEVKFAARKRKCEHFEAK
jgi:hypothetical protein